MQSFKSTLGGETVREQQLTPYEGSVLSLLSYKDSADEINKENLLAGWLCKEVRDGEKGFSASVFINAFKKIVTISIRGTSSFAHLHTDLELALNYRDGRLKEYLEQADVLYTQYSSMESYKNYQFFFTGHSLGGYIAQRATIAINQKKPKQVKALTFDNPGIKSDQEKQVDQDQLVAYLTGPNLINSITPHIGKIFYIPIPSFDSKKQVKETTKNAKKYTKIATGLASQLKKRAPGFTASVVTSTGSSSVGGIPVSAVSTSIYGSLRLARVNMEQHKIYHITLSFNPVTGNPWVTREVTSDWPTLSQTLFAQCKAEMKTFIDYAGLLRMDDRDLTKLVEYQEIPTAKTTVHSAKNVSFGSNASTLTMISTVIVLFAIATFIKDVRPAGLALSMISLSIHWSNQMSPSHIDRLAQGINQSGLIHLCNNEMLDKKNRLDLGYLDKSSKSVNDFFHVFYKNYNQLKEYSASNKYAMYLVLGTLPLLFFSNTVIQAFYFLITTSLTLRAAKNSTQMNGLVGNQFSLLSQQYNSTLQPLEQHNKNILQDKDNSVAQLVEKFSSVSP